MNESTVSNGIQTRQNQEENVAKLVAADRLYKAVKRLNFLNFSLEVIFPFLLSFVRLFYQNHGPFFETLPCLLSIMSMLLSFRLKPAIHEKVNLAAAIKQDYDVSVYQMPWSRELFGTKRDLTREIAENSVAGDSRRDERAGFRNWYREEADALPLQRGIFACQRENYAWDSGLRARYKNLCVWGSGVLIALVVLMELFRGASTPELLWCVAFILPILKWLLDTVGDLNEDLKRLEKMKSAFQSADTRSMEDLQEIQKLLYEHRKNAVTPPGFLYCFFQSSDEEIARHTMEIESCGKRDETDTV